MVYGAIIHLPNEFFDEINTNVIRAVKISLLYMYLYPLIVE